MKKILALLTVFFLQCDVDDSCRQFSTSVNSLSLSQDIQIPVMLGCDFHDHEVDSISIRQGNIAVTIPTLKNLTDASLTGFYQASFVKSAGIVSGPADLIIYRNIVIESDTRVQFLAGSIQKITISP